MAITLDELQVMQSDLDAAKDSWLRAMGWTHHCDHPGGLWLWHKEVNGRLYMVSESTAMFIEETICPAEQFGEPIDG